MSPRNEDRPWICASMDVVIGNLMWMTSCVKDRYSGSASRVPKYGVRFESALAIARSYTANHCIVWGIVPRHFGLARRPRFTYAQLPAIISALIESRPTEPRFEKSHARAGRDLHGRQSIAHALVNKAGSSEVRPGSVRPLSYRARSALPSAPFASLRLHCPISRHQSGYSGDDQDASCRADLGVSP